jgi:hypothetical protein
MSIAHRTDLEQPAIFPLVSILLELSDLFVSTGVIRDSDRTDLIHQSSFLLLGFL